MHWHSMLSTCLRAWSWVDSESVGNGPNFMNRLARLLAASIAAWLLISPARAGIADDISIPVFKELRFSRDSVAIVLPHGTYTINRKPSFAKQIYQRTLTAQFAEPNSPKLENLTVETGGIIGDRWALPDGTALESRPGYCGEGQDQALQFSKNGHPIKTFLGTCDRVSSVAVRDQQLWLGSVSPGEWGDGPGSGVIVLSLQTDELIAQILPKRDLADGFVQLVQVDPFTNDVWIATRTALHRVHRLKVIDRWYVSEQFSTNGKTTYEISTKRRASSPWAIWARSTGIINPDELWKRMRAQPKLRDRLRFAYDEEGYFFSVDGSKLEPIYQPGGSLPKDVPASWPSDFGWLMDSLMTTLQRAPSITDGSLPDTTYRALQQLCFFKDQRVIPFVLGWQQTRSGGSNLERAVAACLQVQNQLLRHPS